MQDVIDCFVESTKKRKSNAEELEGHPATKARTTGTVQPSSSTKEAETPSDPHSPTSTDISNNRKASVSSFKGKMLLNLREYYHKDGQLLPGKKGISLSKDQAEKLNDAKVQLTEALAAQNEISVPLSTLRYAKVTCFKGKYSVDVREYYEKEGEEKPGAKGLQMPEEQWSKLVHHLDAFVKQL